MKKILFIIIVIIIGYVYLKKSVIGKSENSNDKESGGFVIQIKIEKIEDEPDYGNHRNEQDGNKYMDDDMAYVKK